MNLEGQQLGEFEILERIGQGGMGAVYKARQTKLKRLVALKTLQPSIAEDADYIARFEQEAVAAAGLNHPNLVQVHSAGENDGLHWFAMEYVEGESAKDRLKRKGRIEPLEAIAITLHVATALEYGWRKAQLIHRDIKPDNIFLSLDGEVKLGDLGLAKSAGQAQGITMTGHSMGTPHYISPEQVQNMKEVDLRADIYSLGCTLYHFLSGQAPFDGNSSFSIMMQHVNGPVPSLNDVWPECPPTLNDVVGKMMQKNPGDRQQDYAEVISDLRHAYDVVSNPEAPTTEDATPEPVVQTKTADAITPSGSIPQQKPKPVRSKVAAFAGICIIALAMAAAGYIKMGRRQLTSIKNPTDEHGGSTGMMDTASHQTSENWEDGFASKATLNLGTGAEYTPTGLKLAPMGLVRIVHDDRQDGAVRFHTTFDGGATRGPQIMLRNSSEGSYQLYLQGADLLMLELWNMRDGATVLERRSLQEPLKKGQSYELELRAVGRALTAKLNGTVVATVSDDKLTKGWFQVGLVADKNGPVAQIEALHILDLDLHSLPTLSSGMPTKDAPFVNSLGMKFVPVPIIGGPTGGQRVLFSIWDTRAQDYEVFVKETGKTWNPWGGFSKGTLPAQTLSWDSALAFCKWLTERERNAGRISGDVAYRLPTDHEWSCAVGIGEQENPNASPAEKRTGIPGVYPWGITWPPPPQTGNFADDSLMQSSEAKKHDNKTNFIANYNDGFPNLAPVGSFPANKYGLYDMTGNLLNWCDGWLDENVGNRLVRGSSWLDASEIHLRSDWRDGMPSSSPSYTIGFRCVLAPARTTTSITPDGATKDSPFVNSLGMKFVPIPGTKVLFSIWATRVQDYKAYAAENKVNTSWMKIQKDGVPVSRDPEYPVVGVSWEDAQGFNKWLTNKEIGEGKLPKDAHYRLSTDEEWSTAVGLPPEQGTTPAEKSVKNKVDFPWGEDYPPGRKVGNYADEAFHAKFPLKENPKEDWSNNRWIEGYTDGYATTSPVGSFPANAYGLYDMGGNVWQWCEDWYDASHKDRVLRGSSWVNDDRGALLSSRRFLSPPDFREFISGFRCVLEVPAK